MARRIKARSDFYHAAHDPHLPIDIYINKITAGCSILKGLGCEPGDSETTDVLLMNLHPLWSSVRTSITSNKDEQKLADVISILNGSSVDPPVKDKDDETPLGALAASNARFGSGGRRGGAGGGNRYNGGGHGGAGGGNRYSGGSHGGGGGYGGGSSGAGVIIGATPPTKITAIVVVILVILQCGAFTICLSTSRIGVMTPCDRANTATVECTNNTYVLGYDFNIDVGIDSDDEHTPQYSNGVQIPLRI
ncbi:hypothetical protein B0H14DRAFT_2560557 [Mycena olivaceomarginata]|nr:hypothetical protein B0H14DRAFT_2560557 [Mycena olivaceomarginata]